MKVALAADNDSLDGIDVARRSALEFVLVFAVWATLLRRRPGGGRVGRPRGAGRPGSARTCCCTSGSSASRSASRGSSRSDPGQDIPTPDVAAVAIPLAEIYLALIVISLMSRRRPLGRLIRVAARRRWSRSG